MNWLGVGIVLLVGGIILIAIGINKARQVGEAPPAPVQTGYLFAIFGAFAIIAQYMHIGDTMFIFVVLTGSVTLLNRLILVKRRREGQLEPSWVEFSREFFPILLIVFLIRGFLVEPFQIPSSSMRPGLIPDDFILVNKFSYGLRMPLTNKVLIPVGTPQHGDVMVFYYPNNPNMSYIKRVIGVPGDIVRYQHKQLTVNAEPIVMENLNKTYRYTGEDNRSASPQMFRETYDGKSYTTLVEKDYPSISLGNVQEFADRENCQYDDDGFACTVPLGSYFVMGDNRDHSGDSRYWGFVPDKYVVGKAFFIWLNFGAFSRIGQSIK